MKWNYGKPLCYKTGDWDGKQSDEVVAEDKYGKKYLSVLYEGFLDGSEFSYWYDKNEYKIETEIVRFLEITD